MVEGHKIDRKVELSEFSELISNYSKLNISCTTHTFFRLNEQQRKIFKCATLKEYILSQKPTLIGIQKNKCYAVFYKYKKQNFIRLILDIQLETIEIVTFYIIDANRLPKIK